ncbi:unnamed protein product [Nyctereutes procyonoides]|uniref:(raccoon dog) hypothetical protein n=1 Tax=Nyctereutes procyonoides TaxID=34880 RepID=A0A811ZES7_NYCPR|nr:unnamed protein product [Nyctereutes procyonoides]
MMQNKVDVRGALLSTAPATTTVINVPEETVVPDHVVWSLFNTIFLNSFCLGFVAFVYSVKARDRKMVGDLTRAQSFAPPPPGASTSGRWSWASYPLSSWAWPTPQPTGPCYRPCRTAATTRSPRRMPRSPPRLPAAPQPPALCSRCTDQPVCSRLQ